MGHNTSRRDFLKASLSAAAVGGTAPWLMPAAARGAEAAAPGDRIGVAIIGMGKMASGHLGHLLNLKNVHVTALCDVETIRLERSAQRVQQTYADRYGKADYTCPTTTDFRRILERSDTDAVLVATPTNWHAAISVAACEAGKDVYCEKPLALTVREARAISDAARRFNRVFQTGSQQRSEWGFRFASELVRNNRIGKVHTIHVNVGGPPQTCHLPAEPCPETLDWDMWVGPAKWRPYSSTLCPLDDYRSWPSWRYYEDFGGGAMCDWGAHHFDIAQWAMGMDESGPVEILPPDGADITRLTYRYADGTVMTHGGASGEAGVEFLGPDGRIGVNRGFLEVEPEDLRQIKWGPGDTRLYETRGHVENWLDCIRTRRDCICTAEIGCRSVTVCHLGNIAYKLKRPLRWDPAAERFKDDPEADRLLSRAMRAPWRV